jgi:glycosyltransferase involved in cell wall biosynthesis
MSESKRSVLQVVTSTDRRGPEVFAVELGSALAGLGWDVHTVALAPGASDNPLDLPVLGARSLGVRTLRSLRSRMRSFGLTLAHGSRTLPATALAAAGTPARFVYRAIGDPRYWASSALRRARAGWAMRRAAAVVALSERSATAVASHFEIPREGIEVIPQAVDGARYQPATPTERSAARSELGLPEEAPVVAFLGALVDEKDPVRAIEAVSLLDGAHLVIAGADGSARAAVAAAAANQGDRVHLLGVLRDPRLCYAAADAVVLTSRSEGMPAVLIEAGMCEVPTVTTDVGFVRDIVIDGETGYIASSRDPADLAHALGAALAARQRLGAAARRRCLERFSLETAARAWDALLSSVARG